MAGSLVPLDPGSSSLLQKLAEHLVELLAEGGRGTHQGGHGIHHDECDGEWKRERDRAEEAINLLPRVQAQPLEPCLPDSCRTY